MKRTILIAVACSFIIANIANGQRSYEKSDIENLPTVYWFGVDLSKAFLIEGFNHAYATQQGYFSGWNTFLLSTDVNLGKLLHKNEVITNLQIVNDRNKNYSYNSFKITPDTVQAVIDQYTYPYPEGVGVVLIVDNFDKPHEKAYAWMTYFDLKSKKVLSTELLMGKTSMGGMVTHWGEALVRIIKEGAIYPVVLD